MRCAGYNNVDLVAAKELGLTVVRVPAILRKPLQNTALVYDDSEPTHS